MQVEQLSTASGQLMEGPLLITPKLFGDDRGFFYARLREAIHQHRLCECSSTQVTPATGAMLIRLSTRLAGSSYEPHIKTGRLSNGRRKRLDFLPSKKRLC